MKLNFKNISLILAQITWILPFLAFCIGYFCLQFFIVEKLVQTPDLIGKDMLQATKICSDLKLNLRIIAEKEITDAIAGTIITQNPLPHASIKTHQSIFIVITALPAPLLAPKFIDKNFIEIEQTCKDKGIKTRSYFLPSHLPTGQCFGQIPLPDQQLDVKKMSYYISSENQNQYLFPDFTNNAVEEVTQFLEQQGISFDVYQKNTKIIAPYKQNLIVTYQKPLAGTFITPSNKLYAQLQVA